MVEHGAYKDSTARPTAQSNSPSQYCDRNGLLVPNLHSQLAPRNPISTAFPWLEFSPPDDFRTDKMIIPRLPNATFSLNSMYRQGIGIVKHFFVGRLAAMMR